MENIKKLVEQIQDFDFKLEFKKERDPIIKIKFQALHHLQSGDGFVHLLILTMKV